MAKEIENPKGRHQVSSNGNRKRIEEALINIWAGVLRVPQIDRNANFFEIGGDSLKAMDVIGRVREVLQVDLPLITFFEDPTVNHLAEVLSGESSALADSLKKIWCEVLHLEDVDLAANFFEIGGDSLKAMDVIARISDTLHCDLPLVAFFEEPTIRHLTAVLTGKQGSSEEQLAEIWEDTLRVSGIDKHANFFDLGGDSLKAMEVIVRVNEGLHVDLPLLAFFEEPTIAHLAAVVDELKASGTTPPITRVVDRQEFPLSYSQQVFWLLEQQNPGTGIYNKPRVFRIHGDVNAEVMQRSLNELRKRHEILRVRFVAGVNGPAQVVVNDGCFSFAVTDLSSLEAADREETAMKLVLETVREPLDLAAGEVERARLIQLGAHEYILCIAEHHVVNDGFTGSILLDELGVVYDALAAGQPNPLPPPQVHYTDFAAWEQQWMEGERLASEIEHWRALLSDVPKLLDVPTDIPPSTEPDRRGHLHSIMISPELLGRVQAMAQGNGTTQFTVMSAALRLLMYRWSGQSDFLLGTTASNRSRSGTERMPGPFVNPLPLRNAIAEGQTAQGLLNDEKKAVMEAFAHQDCPFAKIVEAVNPERTGDDNPLFNVGLVMENFPEIGLKGAHFDAEYLNFDPEVSLIDLRFIAIEKNGGLRLSCEYKTPLFSEETIDELLHAYAGVLDQMTASPAKALADFELPQYLARQAGAKARERKRTIAIAATYTAEPIEEALKFWLEQLQIRAKIEFAPFNQVFQQLLDPTSLLATNEHGANVALLRIEDLLPKDEGTTTVSKGLESAVEDLLGALRHAAAQPGAVPVVVIVGPPSDTVLRQPDLAKAVERAEGTLLDGARGISGVQVVGSYRLLQQYPVRDYGDEYGYKISHIPYKSGLFVAMATVLARSLFGLTSGGREVLVLDSDSTLWEKDASTEIVVPQVPLQQLAVDQEAFGMLLCLCGREAEAAVAARFESTAGMKLDWQIFAASHFGVRAKSDGLRQLANDLGLGLNRFVFITRDALDAAEVRANCPSVLVAEPPRDVEQVPNYLANFWAFDHRPAEAVSAEQDPVHSSSELLNRIATQLNSVEAIHAAIESSKTLRSRAVAEYAPPRTQVEEFLADAWARLLRLERVGIHDNFFGLGGHSLMAAQVIARVREKLGVELPLRTMFEAPTVAQFAEVTEKERRTHSGVVIPPMTRASRSGEIPLSYAQQRLWFIDQLEPGNALYNLASMYRMRGTLNIAALEQTINEIVRRHESLRTSFRDVDGRPMQVIAPELRISLSVTSLGGVDEAQRQAELQQLAYQEAVRPFDLSKGPLLRTRLVRLDEDDHALVVAVHHIVGDGWSGSMIAAEMRALYPAFANGDPSPLTDLPTQYADFAVWQRQWLEGELREKQVKYWRQQLAGAPAVLELPTDRPRQVVQIHRGDLQKYVLPRELFERLQSFSRAEGVTLFMVLLAGFQALLAKYSGQDDIVVGSPMAGRVCTEIEPLIGFFVNTVPLRTNLAGNPSVREVLTRVKDVVLGADAHQHVPFERLVEELQPERSLSYNPIFQVAFGLQNMPRQEFEAGGLQVQRTMVHQGTSVFDMHWFASVIDGELMLRIEYDTDLYRSASIDRAFGHFEKLLEAFVAHPESRLSELSLLTEQESQKLLVDWNNTATDYPRDVVAHELFERWAKTSPDLLAVVDGYRRLSYGELNRRSNQLAHRLRSVGVGPDSVVAICMDRSLDMVVSVLGVLKAGGAYLPIDPTYPKERLAFMLGDAGVAVPLTESKQLGQLPSIPHVICVDRDWTAIEKESEANPAQITRADNLAYVIYTSGSTGKPKGVEIEHRGLVNLVAWHQREYDVRPEDRATQLASPAFDASVWEIWPYLASGASLHIPDEETRMSPAKLVDWLERESITLAFLPTPLAEAVLDTLKTKDATRLKLRALLTGGDKLHQRTDQTLPFKLMNHYGPTENSVVTTWAPVTLDSDAAPPIGRPIANTRVYVLDELMHPVPIGVPGELYIAGDGLARGYRNRPETTAEKFVRDVFAAEVGRLYRTGDRVRYLPDGNLEFLGRIDQQVKIRGFRIELGEIEAMLAQHPAVKECVADAREDTPGNKRLAAYLVLSTNYRAVTNGESALSALVTEIRGWMRDQLPEYMVPAAFGFLETIPLTPNGKVNRRALPAPMYGRDESRVHVEPRTLTEEQLATIWMDVLRVPRVGVYDDFFDLGGHSLLATQVVSRIREWAGVDVPLRLMFETPTIDGLAPRVERIRSGQSEEKSPIQRTRRDQPIPLSFAQQRLWFLDQLDPDTALYNAPWAIRMKGALNPEALTGALNELVRRHEVFRTTFTSIDGQPFQVIAPELKIQVATIDISGVPVEQREAEVQRLAVEAAQQPFNLKTGPVFRAKLVRTDAQEHVLLLNSHHIANDGWSMWQFIRDLGTAYEAICESKPCNLSEMPIQYADFAVWQRSYVTGDVLDRQLSYWKKRLDGAPDTLELPTDFLRPASLSYRGAVERRVCSRTLGDKLSRFSRSENATLYMTLLAAYQALLYRYSGQEDIVVGSPIANRTRSETEGLIGFFVNTILMRADLSGNPTFRELLHRVREDALGAYSNQDVPFEKVVEVLRPDRYLGRLPMFQVWFALQNVPRTEFRLGGIELSSIDAHNGTSKFDLGLFAVERPDGLHLYAEYSTDLFHATTIQRFLSHYQLLLEMVLENPDRCISDISILTEEERQQVVSQWNDTQTDHDRESSLHKFFEEQAERSPDAPALISGSELITYGELNSRANQLAHYLRKLGAGPEVLVGIYSERSTAMLVGILGILKAGSAYVPLDPNYPKERIRQILEDAKSPLVLTQKTLAGELVDLARESICLDSDWESIAEESRENPIAVAGPMNLAYVLFTSGSTGRPKGVAIEHRAAAAFVHWANQVFTSQELRGVLLSTSICFDLSVFEIFVTWSAGGKVIVAENAMYLPSLPAKDEVTLINTVPSAMAELVRMKGVPESVVTVNLAGEPLPETLVSQIYERTSVRRVYNLYGPTEDTTYSTYTLVKPTTLVTIGKPIANSQAYILDSLYQPVPIGVSGELYLAGEGLSRGYYGRPDLTAERFVPNPLSARPSARMYRTGDLCRWLPGGDIQYLGRADHQVKLRGFRIELGEIESALDAHPALRQSVVMAREDEPGEKRLVAYVVADPDYHDSQGDAAEEVQRSEQVSQWAATFDEAYLKGGNATDATFNISGWDSSYTGQAIPSEEMRVWVESTAERIRALGAKRIWEIGCGTGLLLFRVAPACEHYHGTDISQTALDFLKKQLQRPELALSGITLDRKAAHELDPAASGTFDAVVLNSVAQYFPNLDYLVQVIEAGVRSLRPGGTMFLGDLRNFKLLETFHASVQLFQADESTTREQFWRRVESGVRQERELLIDPAFFAALRHRIPAISSVQLQLKRGWAQNELTRFRYDVVLHVGNPAAAIVNCAQLDWKAQALSTDHVLRILREAQPEALAITGIPNARLAAEMEAIRLLKASDGPATVGGVRELLGLSTVPGVEPEELFDLAEKSDYVAEIRPSTGDADDRFDVVFRRHSDASPTNQANFGSPFEQDRPIRSWESYANNPLRQQMERELVPQLRQWLGRKLPEYMVPSAFVLLDSMPLSANGKVDRRALPAPERSAVDASGEYRAPQTLVEQMIAAVFSEVLRIERVGLDDNFFELGGHSLSATQMVARIRQNLNVELPVRALFESPTVATLALAVELKQRAQQGTLPPSLLRVPRNQRLPLSFAQQRLWVLDQLEPNSSLYNMPRALRLTGSLSVEALDCALNGIIARHEILRTTYAADKGEPYQIIAPELKQKLPLIDLSGLLPAQRESEARRIVQEQSSLPFDLANDPISRHMLLKLADDEYILIMATHHIASDGWSTGVLVRELTALYESALSGKAADLPELEVQYADYAVWQRNWLKNDVLEQQVAYWRARLAGAPPVLQLPADRPRPEKPTFRGTIYRSLLPPSLAESVRVLSRQQGCTTFMTMLAGFQTVVAHCTGSRDIVLGTDLANRSSVQTEALIGFFVNLLALRADLSGDPTFAELMARDREVALGAYAHQDVPFDKLVEQLQPERSLSHNPLVQVLFVQQNTPRSTMAMGGLKMKWEQMEVLSKFDLAVFVAETNEGTVNQWAYSAELFDPPTIARMAGLYQLVLEKATANPALRLSEIHAVLAEEDKQHRSSLHKEFQQSSAQKLKTARRKTLI